LGAACCLWAAWPQGAAAERIYVNDKEAPEDRHDLDVIQQALSASLERARNATVCIDLGEGAGSGVIVSADGLILSAAHVTGGTDKELTIVLADGRRVQAQSLGLVADTDCAMARIDGGGSYPFVEIERKDSVKLGDWVYSLGHSGGYEDQRGPVVRIGRVVRIADSTFQSDCTLIGGDSGGPLFDLAGRLVGIHSRVGLNLEQNMHVPMREFLRHWDGLLAGQFVGEGPFAKRPRKGEGFLGIGSEDLPGGGVRVKKVGRESPAEKAGVREHDLLLEFNGAPVATKQQFQAALAELAPGAKVKLRVRRGDQELEMETKLDER
jgi:serine protease Do